MWDVHLKNKFSQFVTNSQQEVVWKTAPFSGMTQRKGNLAITSTTPIPTIREEEVEFIVGITPTTHNPREREFNSHKHHSHSHNPRKGGHCKHYWSHSQRMPRGRVCGKHRSYSYKDNFDPITTKEEGKDYVIVSCNTPIHTSQ